MLDVVLGTMRDCKNARWPDDGRKAWRVRYIDNVTGKTRVLPMQFARESDARAAMTAIEQMADWNQPREILYKTLDIDLVRLRMVEAMAW